MPGPPLSTIAADFTITAGAKTFTITECNTDGCDPYGRYARVGKVDPANATSDDVIELVCYSDEGSFSLVYRAKAGSWSDFETAQAETSFNAFAVVFDPYTAFTPVTSLQFDQTEWDAAAAKTVGSINVTFENGVAVTGTWGGVLADCREDAALDCGKVQP